MSATVKLYKVSVRYEVTEDPEALVIFIEASSVGQVASLLQPMLDGNCADGGKRTNDFWSLSSIEEVGYDLEVQA